MLHWKTSAGTYSAFRKTMGSYNRSSTSLDDQALTQIVEVRICEAGGYDSCCTDSNPGNKRDFSNISKSLTNHSQSTGKLKAKNIPNRSVRRMYRRRRRRLVQQILGKMENSRCFCS